MTSTLRCLRVLELLVEEPFELSVSKLARQLGLPKASASRVLNTLVAAGFVYQEADTQAYRLAAKSLWVGTGYLRHSAVYRASFFPMSELSQQITGAVQLGIIDAGAVLFLHAAGYPGSAHLFADVGLRRPAHATATGKAILAYVPARDARRIMANGRGRLTKNATTTLSKMKKELERVRRIGYATNDEELVPGFSVIAAPVFDNKGDVVAAISITTAASELASETQARYSRLVRETALKISRQLGFQPLSGNSVGRTAKLARPASTRQKRRSSQRLGPAIPWRTQPKIKSR